MSIATWLYRTGFINVAEEGRKDTPPEALRIRK